MYKKLLKLALLILSLSSCNTASKIQENTNKDYNLVWSDEFDETAINTNNWSYQVEPAGRFNNEWQAYTNSSDNAYIENGNMVIEAKYNGNGLAKGNFTSARMITQGKKNFKYGKVQARIKVPYGQGIWPAFWMLGSNIKENNPNGTVNWPYCGEIDIMEKVGGGIKEKELHGTIHFWEDSKNKWTYIGGKTTTTNNLADDFHVYEVEWDAEKIIWKLDGIEYHRQNISSSDYDEFRNEFYILLNVAVGGDWPGAPNSTTTFPQKMLIDWVRVYQK